MVVIVGRWNPHIFSIDWVAKHLFDYREGATVEVVQMMSPGLAPIFLIQDVGFRCTRDRLEIFAREGSEACLRSVETLAVKALSTLSHTPVSAIGANFDFIEDDVPPEMADLLATPERMETKFTIVANSFETRIDLEKDVTLGIRRGIIGGAAQISLNYHRESQNAAKLAEIIPGLLERRWAHARELLLSLYQIEESGVLTLDGREEANDQEQA